MILGYLQIILSRFKYQQINCLLSAKNLHLSFECWMYYFAVTKNKPCIIALTYMHILQNTRAKYLRNILRKSDNLLHILLIYLGMHFMDSLFLFNSHFIDSLCLFNSRFYVILQRIYHIKGDVGLARVNNIPSYMS